MNNWSSVKDCLPEEGKDVWCNDGKKGIIIGYYWKDEWSHIYGDNDGLEDDRLYQVTHWQPIDKPNPPNE